MFSSNFDKILIAASSNIVSYLDQKTAHEYCDYLLKLIKEGDEDKLLAEVDICRQKSKGLSAVAALFITFR